MSEVQAEYHLFHEHKLNKATKPVIGLRYEFFRYMGRDENLPVQRRVVCAANRYDDVIVTGARHFDSVMHKQLAALGKRYRTQKAEQGFIDQFGVFMDRKEALAVAVFAGQVNTVRPKSAPAHLLFSEDLY